MIAIKNMKMPENCERCDLITDTYEGGPDDLCVLLQKKILGDRRRNDCPLVEVKVASEEPGWVTRMREEYKELQRRREKLCDYYTSVIFDETVTFGETYYLSMQLDAMRQYAHALEKRAEMKGYTLEVKEEGGE